MQPRTYRHWIEGKGLVAFNVIVKETDLYIRAVTNLQKKARQLVEKHRRSLENYIVRNPAFLGSLRPLNIGDDAPQIARQMAVAAQAAGVGPMAAVAGAIAECVGRELLKFSPEIIVENGGDIFLRSSQKIRVGIYAGTSPLTGTIGMEIRGQDEPCGICTSSGTVGHSLSLGKADAVVVTAPSAILADAAATAIANIVTRHADIPEGIALAQNISGLSGVVIIKGEHIGAWGDITLCPTSGETH